VAIARALAIQPRVLLLDEPLSNLDAKLREEMRGDIRDLQQKTGITAMYVTHDQEEALSISDRVVVMNAGMIEQVGTPREIYRAPSSPFVANFIGGSNLIPVKVCGLFMMAKCEWSKKAGLNSPYGARRTLASAPPPI